MPSLKSVNGELRFRRVRKPIADGPPCVSKFLPRNSPSLGLDSNLLDLVERYLVVRAVVELGGAGTLVRGHHLGVFKGPAVIEVCGDAGGAEGVIADRRGNAGVRCAALKHAPCVGLAHRAIGKNSGAPEGGAEKRPLAVAGEAGCFNVVLKVSLEMMVAGRAVFLAAFLVQADPQTAVLPVNGRHGLPSAAPMRAKVKTRRPISAQY